MKFIRTLIFVSIISLLVVSGVQAQSSLSNQTIAARCPAAQAYAQDVLKPNDLRGRVDRLQAYQYIYQRLELLVKRLEHNNQVGAIDLRTNLTRYQQEVQQFKVGYEHYDSSREALSQLEDCPTKPTQFKQLLNRLRASRRQLARQINRLDKLLETETRSQLIDLQAEFLKTEGTERDR